MSDLKTVTLLLYHPSGTEPISVPYVPLSTTFSDLQQIVENRCQIAKDNQTLEYKTSISSTPTPLQSAPNIDIGSLFGSDHPAIHIYAKPINDNTTPAPMDQDDEDSELRRAIEMSMQSPSATDVLEDTSNTNNNPPSATADNNGDVEMTDAQQFADDEALARALAAELNPNTHAPGGVSNNPSAMQIEQDDTPLIFTPFEPFDFHGNAEQFQEFGQLERMDDGAYADFKMRFWGASVLPNDKIRWYSQGFQFCEEEKIRFGFLQLQGGPCGILAGVQAFLISEILFGESRAEVRRVFAHDEEMKIDSEEIHDDASRYILMKDEVDEPIKIDDSTRHDCFVDALVDILSAARGETHDVVGDDEVERPFRIVVNVSHDPDTGDELDCHYVQCSGEDDLRRLLHSEPFWKLCSSCTGVISFVYSVLLTRGMTVICDDMDDPMNGLLQEFGNCSQELVNLILTGRAVTNVHDGDKVLGGGDPNAPDAFVLKGISENVRIGFLTSLEAMHLVKVGLNYKNPSIPIWIVGSHTHYSVLFCLNAAVCALSSAQKEEQKFINAWNDIDVEETGMIVNNKATIRRLLDSCGLNHVAEWKLVNSMEQVLLRSDFLLKVSGLIHSKNSQWICKRCTLHNSMQATICGVCGAPRPMSIEPHNLIRSKSEEERDASYVKPPETFTMFHFNGIVQHVHDKPTLTRMYVFVDADLNANVPIGFSEELTMLMRTKWPHAVVEHVGGSLVKMS